MAVKEKGSINIKELRDLVRQAKADVVDFAKNVDQAANLSKTELKKTISQGKRTLKTTLNEIEERIKQLKIDFKEKVSEKTKPLLAEIEQLKKANESITSDNYLLEYKKKDLLLLADQLEDAYEEISLKNKELQEQKQQIQEQSDRLKFAHEEILNKNMELEMQKESIQDQADYLHEANETITKMHEEVQEQKDEILKKNEELISLNNEKNNLISIVAHDLKSPLNQINGLLMLVKMTAEGMSEDTMKYLNTIEGSTNRLTSMIAKILDVEAIESKTLNLNIENTDLAIVLRDIIERAQVLANDKNITLIEEIKDENICAAVDKGYANQIYENLISNAIKFSPKEKKVFIKLKSENGKALCEVKDQGPGISKEDQKKLFGKYQKLSAKPTGNETSTGLGLSIVKKYVEAMNGKIWCESQLGDGASFFVTFENTPG